MAAASVNLSCFLATRPITSTRSSSRVLIAVLFNKTSLAGGLSLRGHFYSVREGTLSKSFNRANATVRCWPGDKQRMECGFGQYGIYAEALYSNFNASR